MRKSLFRKYLLLISVIVFGSFIIMGAIFFVSMSNYWVGDKLDNLKENVETIAAYVGNKTVKTADNSYELPVEAQTLQWRFPKAPRRMFLLLVRTAPSFFVRSRPIVTTSAKRCRKSPWR